MSRVERSPEGYLHGLRWLLIATLALPVIWDVTRGVFPPGGPWLLLLMAAVVVQLLTLSPHPRAGDCRLLAFLLLDIVLWNGVVVLTGGASNPFAALLLIPLVLGLLLLPVRLAMVVMCVSIVCQLLQLLFLPDTHDHGNMSSHYFAMGIGFVIAALLLTLTLLYLRGQIQQRDRDLQQLRESQLRDEQLVAIGTAAAQLTHEMATPVQSVRLLLEELTLAAERAPTPDRESLALQAAMQQQLGRMEQLLADWRGIAEDVRERRLRPIALQELVQSISELLVITRPGQRLQWQGLESLPGASVLADRTLVPAVLSLLHNALDAADDGVVTLESQRLPSHWRLTIFNAGKPMARELRERLGSEFVASESGFGVGALVSYATLERFGGRVYWQAAEEGTRTLLELPLYCSDVPDLSEKPERHD